MKKNRRTTGLCSIFQILMFTRKLSKNINIQINDTSFILIKAIKQINLLALYFMLVEIIISILKLVTERLTCIRPVKEASLQYIS